MKLRCVALAALGLCALPPAASAGPLSLGYHAEVLDNAGSRLTLPADGTISLEQQTDRSWKGSLNVFWPQDNYPPADLPASATDGQFYSYTNEFRVRLTLTDPASGQTGAVTLSGVEQGGWEYFVNWDPGPPFGPWTGWRFTGSNYEMDAAPDRLTLGGVDYGFAAGNGITTDRSDLVVTAAASTPEPGTLRLGGLALVPVGLRALRRRR